MLFNISASLNEEAFPATTIDVTTTIWMSRTVKIIVNLHNQLGEGLWWSSRENAVFWVDILKPALHRYSLTTEQTTVWPMPEKLGWVVERTDRPGLIAGMQSGFVELTLDPVTCTHMVDPEPGLPNNRMNDAAVDRHGRIWAGTMDCDIALSTGSLYTLDAQLGIIRRDSGYLVTNGPAFSADHRHMYHSDTGLRVIYRFALSAEGDILDKDVFLIFPQEWGSPDGMAIDVNGYLWVCHWGGARVSRFTPTGKLDRSVQLPTANITNCVFGGQGLDRLFVSSAAVGSFEDPLAGALFEIDAGGVRGLAPNLFAG